MHLKLNWMGFCLPTGKKIDQHPCYILHLTSVILSLWNETNSCLVGSWIYCASISIRLSDIPMPCSYAVIHTTLDNWGYHSEDKLGEGPRESDQWRRKIILQQRSGHISWWDRRGMSTSCLSQYMIHTRCTKIYNILGGHWKVCSSLCCFHTHCGCSKAFLIFKSGLSESSCRRWFSLLLSSLWTSRRRTHLPFPNHLTNL